MMIKVSRVYYKPLKIRLALVSLNCQSINGKFDKLNLFVAHIITCSTISVLCVQETWSHGWMDMASFQLPNYSIINLNRRLSNHGGLVTYLHDDFSYKSLTMI